MPRGHILRGQLRIPSISTDLSTYPVAHATNGSARTDGAPFWIRPLHYSEGAEGQVGESY